MISIKSNLVNPRDYEDLPHIAPDNIESFTTRLLPFNSIKESRVTSPKHYFYKSSLLYSKIRPNLAKVVKVDFEGLCSADMYPLRVHVFEDYILNFMVSLTKQILIV